MALNPRSWRNSDGLNVWFGKAEGVSSPAPSGELVTNTNSRMVEQVITLTDLTSTAAFIDTHNTIPVGAFIEKVDVVAIVAGTSAGSATLNIGLKGTDESTNVSDTALVSALALTTHDALGETTSLTVGATGAGSSLGVATTAKNYITAKWGTAAYTAGKVAIRISYNIGV